MENGILDGKPQKQYRKNWLYYVGSFLSIVSLLIFTITTNLLQSLIVCILGIILVWLSPVNKKEKLYSFTPLIGQILVFLAYMYVYKFM